MQKVNLYTSIVYLMEMTMDAFVLFTRNHCKQKITVPTERIILPISQVMTCPTADESSLNLLAKNKIQEAFYESQVITISFEYKSCCKMIDICHYMKYNDCN